MLTESRQIILKVTPRIDVIVYRLLRSPEQSPKSIEDFAGHILGLRLTYGG